MKPLTTLALAIFAVPAFAQQPLDGITQLLQKALETDPAKQQLAAREAAALTFAKYPSPSDWDTAVYLPYRVPNELLSQFVGTKLSLDIEGYGAVFVEITKAELSGEFFQAKAAIGLRVGTNLTDDAAELVSSGRLLYQGFKQTDEKTTSAAFAIGLDAPVASAVVNGKTFTNPEAIKKLVDSGALRIIEERLRFALPMPVEFSQKLHYKGESLLATGDKGWVKVGIEVPGATVRQRVAALEPVFVPSGMWLGIDLENATSAPAQPAAIAPAKDDVVQKALETYQSQSGSVPKVFVKGAFIAQVFNDVGALKKEERTATVTILDHGGNLFDSGGDFYAKAWLENNDGGASLTIAPSAKWDANGLTIDCGYEASARANIHLHVDPSVGGGVGTSVGCSGGSSAILSAAPAPWLITGENPASPGKVLALRPDFKGQDIHFNGKTDGEFKFKILGGMQSLKVPAFGARATVPVPHNIVPSLPLLTDAPRPVTLLSEVKLPAGASLKTPPEKEFPTHLVITPGEPVRDPIGYILPFQIKFSKFAPEEVKSRNDAVAGLLRAEARPDIKVGNIELFIGGISLAPLQQVVKLLVEGIQTAVKAGKQVVRETAKAAEDVGREAKKLADNVERELGTAAKNVGREVGKVGKNVERAVVGAGKDIAGGAANAVKEFGRGVGKAAEGVGNAGQQVGQAVGNAVQGGINEVKKQEKKVENFIKKNNPFK